MTTTHATVTNKLAVGGHVETTEVHAEDGSHWIEQFYDEHGQPTGITVKHPWGSTPRSCALHKSASFVDALTCVETFGTEQHP